MSQRDKVSNQLCEYARNAKSGNTPITASNGCPVDSLTASMTAGKKGPIVLQVLSEILLTYSKVTLQIGLHAD